MVKSLNIKATFFFLTVLAAAPVVALAQPKAHLSNKHASRAKSANKEQSSGKHASSKHASSKQKSRANLAYAALSRKPLPVLVPAPASSSTEAATTPTATPNALSIDQYITQIQGENGEYIAAKGRDEAYELLKKKAALVTAPTFFASAETGYNEQITALPFFRYNRIATQSYSAGISQNSAYGINSKFTYALNKVQYNGLVTTNELAANNYQTRPVIEVTIPLLQNRFGSTTRATRDATEQQNEVLKYNAQAAAVTTVIAAQQSYWNLVAARKIVDVQIVAEKQAQKILDYVTKREKMNLGETADVLQAKALVETKKLELRQAQNDLKIATRNFNRLRNINSEQIGEKLENIDFAKIKNTVLPKIKEATRPDVKAAQASMKAAVANAKIDEENNKPSLNLYGAYAFKGVQAGATDAFNTSFNARGKEGLVGVKFSVPFYLGTIMDVQKGARMVASAARDEYRQKAFNEENDWENLLINLQFFQERTALAKEIEEAQKRKLENERSLLKRGRTSTYQVLLFEQEYCQAQVNLISSANNFLALMAQKKLYEK